MNKIKELRQKTELTQEALASEMGIDRTTVAKWETGEAYPRSDKLPLLAKILGCSIDDLFGNT